jgi:RNA polymerase sigma-70 factor (ECF subfamily)
VGGDGLATDPGLYSVLATIDPSPVVALNRAIARRYVDGPAVALGDVNGLSDQLRGYHLFHAARASLLKELNEHAEAAQADAVALLLTRNSGERRLLEERLPVSGAPCEEQIVART